MVQQVKDWLKKSSISAKYPKLTNGVAVLIAIGVVLLFPLIKAIKNKK